MFLGAGVKFILRRLTGSRRGHWNGTHGPTGQARERIWGTLEFVPLLFMFAKERGKITVRNAVRNIFHLTAHATEMADLKLSGRKCHLTPIQKGKPV